MKTSKPLRAGVMIRPFEIARTVRAVVTVFAPFRLDEPKHLLTDLEMWNSLVGALGEQPIFDEGNAKTSSEVLAAGSCHPPKRPTNVSFVRIAITSADGKPKVDKRIAVFGDRRWKAGVPTEPEPFSEMPLTWDRAFGGDGFERNPLGRGASTKGDGEDKVHPLPNLEDPAKLVRAPSDQPEPFTFLAFDPTWPQRMKKMGKNYDQKWLEERFPGPADDLDPTYYHLAPDNQRTEGYLEGNERFLVENMHPELARLEGELPPVVARAFIARRPAGLKLPRRGRPKPEKLEEVKTRLETLWLVPGAKMGVLVFRGTTPIQDDDMGDLEQLVIGLEDRSEPKSLEHYEAALAARLDPDMGALFAIDDEDLLPAEDLGWKVSFPVFEIEDKIRPEGHLEANQRRAAEAKRKEIEDKLVAMNLDPKDYIATPEEITAPSAREPKKMAAFIKEQLKRAEEEEKRAAEKKLEVEAKTKELEALAIAKSKEHGIDFPKLEDAGRRKVGPPKFEIRMRVENALARAEQVAAKAIDFDDLRRMVGDSKTLARLEQQEERVVEAYRTSGHLFPEGTLPEAGERDARRAQAELAKSVGESLSGVDLSGANLSGLDLSGMDLSSAFLESTSLVGTKLRGAKLDGAVLARADLTDADLGGASLKETNLGASTMVRTNLKGADATGAIFMRAKIRDACLAGVKLDGTLLLEAEVGGVDLSGITGDTVVFYKLALGGSRLDGARLQKPAFIESTLDGASFEGACLVMPQIIATSAKKLSAKGVTMTDGFVGAGSSLDGAMLDGADLSRMSLRTTSLVGASLTGAKLASSDLSECDLTGANLERCVAPKATLTRAVLRGAKARGANLMDAMLSKADLAECDLSQSNLFRADLSRVHLSGGTKIDGALLENARVEPKERKEQP